MNTIIDNKKYILIRNCNNNIVETILNARFISLNYMYTITRSNWVELWSNKIDNIEYQLTHIANKYKLIRDSIWYYIGMAETAISYISNTFNENKMYVNNYLVISHERIVDNNFNNPQNIIIDYKSRDISEYLKYIFLNDKYDYREIDLLFKKLKLNKFLYQLVYGRMFFITFYFDMYDEIINNTVSEDEIKKIITKTSDYEDYLKNIYNIIKKYADIQEINWV